MEFAMKDETFEGTFPFAPHYHTVNGFEMHYHMGMGKSGANAALYPYRLWHHIANLESLLLQLDLHQITLVLHDWGGPVGLGVAIRHPERIKRLVLSNTWAFAPWPGGPFPRLLELIRSERGEKFVLEKNGYLEPALMGTTAHTEKLTSVVLNAYRAPFPTPESRRALLCWSRDIPVNESDPQATTHELVDAPEEMLHWIEKFVEAHP